MGLIASMANLLNKMTEQCLYHNNKSPSYPNIITLLATAFFHGQIDNLCCLGINVGCLSFNERDIGDLDLVILYVGFGQTLL